MGVYCLNTFSKQIGAVKRVNLIEEIHQYRSETNLDPILVIDGLSFCYSIVRNQKLPWLTGGGIHEFEKYFKKFIRMLRCNCVEVVVFFDGVSWMYNTENWIRRRKETVREMYRNVFNKLDLNATIDEVESGVKQSLIPGFWPVANKVLIEEGCQAIKAVCDCDFDIAAFTKKHKCMGIIADDSDFMINCSCNPYTLNELNIDCMTTMKRDQGRLLNTLLIEPKLLPLFASLVGNDIVSYEETQHMNRRIDIGRLFRFLANYIKNLNIKGDISDSILEQVALDIFNDPKKVDLLRKSIDSYDASPEKIEAIVEERLAAEKNSSWSAILKMAFKCLRHGGGCSYIFSIISQNTFQTTASYEDFRKKDMRPIMQILKPLRKIIYGILLYEKPGEHVVTEMVVDNHDTHEPSLVEAVSPRVSHPGLVAIWEKTDVEANWLLLGDAIRICPWKIKNLPGHLCVPALSFRYLKENNAMEKWEIISAIITSVVVSFMSAESFSRIRLRRVQSRPVRLQSLIFRTYDMIRLLIESLGNIIPVNETVPLLYHDGNVFHLIYNAMREGIKPSKILKIGFEKLLNQTTEACEATFVQISSFVFDDSDISFQ